MKYSTKSHSKKSLLLPIIAVVILLAASAFTYQAFNNEGSSKTVEEGLTEQQAKDAEEKEQLINQPDGDIKDEPTDDKTDIDNDTNDQNSTSKNASINASQEDETQVTVKTRVTGASSGDCTLRIVNGGKTKNYKAKLMYQPQFSTCAGFSIPISDLGTGVWNISLTVETGQDTLQSDKITLEVK